MLRTHIGSRIGRKPDMTTPNRPESTSETPPDVNVHGVRITLEPARTRLITIPDYAAMFAGWDGPRPVEDGFANPAGRERM